MELRVEHLLRMAAIVCIASGVIGGSVWLVDLMDRMDGDDLRWGFWHNPVMAFALFNEPFLDLSIRLLLACSVAVGVGGMLLLAPSKLGVPLVTWQARVSIITNGIVVFYIAFMPPSGVKMWWTVEAMVLRLGSIGVNLFLLNFLKSRYVTEFFARPSTALAADSTANAALAHETVQDPGRSVPLSDNPYAPPASLVDPLYTRRSDENGE